MKEMMNEVNLCLLSNDIMLKEKEMNKLIEKLDSINKNVLFKSLIHGLYHSEKVMLFSYLIGLNEKFSDVELEILMDAALYHDIGRTNDDNGETHGCASSYRLYKEKKDILKSSIYDDPVNFAYLRAICDAHSVGDRRMEGIFENYHCDIEGMDYQVFSKLCKALKDADALDRTRFKNSTIEFLKEDLLRYDYSKELVDFAKAVNHIYIKRDIEKKYLEYLELYGNKENEIKKRACFHGIGVDFFKLESILNIGILSNYAMKSKKISSARNFDGSNQDLWISTVDADMIGDDALAYKKYIKGGISLYCFVSRFKSRNDGDANSADINNKNEYPDEKYVFNNIETEQIHSVIIPNEIMLSRVDQLNYLICGTNYQIVKANVEHYKKEIESRSHIRLDCTKVDKILAEHRRTTKLFEELNQQQKEANMDGFFKKLDDYVLELNAEVQKWMRLYSMRLLKKNDTPYVCEMIQNIMMNFDIKNVYKSTYDGETVIVLNPIEKTMDEENKRI